MGCGDANKLLVRKCGLNENLRDRLPILGQVVIAVIDIDALRPTASSRSTPWLGFDSANAALTSSDLPAGVSDARGDSENSKANRIETMKGPAESGQICSGGSKKNSEENSEK